MSCVPVKRTPNNDPASIYMKNRSVHPTSIAMKHAQPFLSTDEFLLIIHLPIQLNSHYFNRRICIDNNLSSSNFHCIETRVVVLINEGTPLINPTSNSMKLALFAATETYRQLLNFNQLPLQ